MVDRPELTTAVAKTKNKASVWNDNVNKIMKYAEDCMAEDKSYVDDALVTVGELSDDVADVKSYAAYITTETGTCPITEAGTFRDEYDIQQIMRDYNEGATGTEPVLYVAVGNNYGNGNWISYKSGNYWKKKTYNNYDTLAEVECGGAIRVKVTLYNSEQYLYLTLPPEMAGADFYTNISLSESYISTDYTSAYGTPPVKNQKFSFDINRMTYLNNKICPQIRMTIPKASSSTTYDCILYWSTRQNTLNRLFEEEEES